MIAYSIIQKSQLEGALRLDAEYYITSTIVGKNFYVGHEIVDFVQYGTSKELNEERLGYPVLRLNEFDSWFIENPAKYCNKISQQIFEQLKLKKGDVLICRTNGNPQLVGKAAVVLDDANIAFASYLFRVRPKSEYINSETLVAYINSTFGRQEIEKYFMVSNQTNFSPAKFREIKIPRFSTQAQDEIKELVNEAYQKNAQSKSLYSQAEGMLLEELGLSSFAKAMEDEERFCIVNFSEIETANRMDAEYFQPKYEKLISKIKSPADAKAMAGRQNSKLLPEVIQNIPAKFNPSAESEKTFQYVELSNINSSIGVIDGSSEILGKEAPSRAKRVLEEGDVIVSSIEGSLEKVALVAKGQEGYLASTGFFQLRSKDEILPEVLLGLAKSIVFQMQLQKLTAGTILSAVPKEAINNVRVPILAKEAQEKIAELVRQSHKARKKAKQLLEEAKRKVEEMIESQSR